MKLGVIGYGGRIRDVIEEVMAINPACRIAAITDIRNEQIKADFVENGGEIPAFYDSPEEMYRDSELDGVMIGTRCSLHAPMAIQALSGTIPIYLEKPVATNYKDLYDLKKAYEASKAEVVVSFPLRLTPLVKLAREIIDSNKLGTIEHVQAYNNVSYGGVYYHDWYRDENETGGLFLQKATHDFDYINYILQARPTMVCAMTSKQIFKGDKPAGLQCIHCDEQDVCEESAVLLRKKGEIPTGEFCCFAQDTGNEDSGSAIIRYESGMHVNYSQNFFVRHQANTRGARFMGYKGTLEFDFCTNQLKVFMHHTNHAETYDVDPGKSTHGGGDASLAQSFIDIMKGDKKSVSSLGDGLLSALMCLKARESARTNTFQEIVWDK